MSPGTRQRVAKALSIEGRGLYAVARRVAGSATDPEDLVQEALLRYGQALERGRVIASPGGWLKATVTRLAIDALRSAHARARATDPGSLDATPAPGRTRDADVIERLRAALARCGPREAEVFVMVHVSGFTAKEAAEHLGIEPGTARTYLAEAMRKLRRRLADLRPRDAQREVTR